ncbi:MAG: sensor histidine kinase, partial [Opitutaceae bacterium]|nr:sensor histidine kinase [Cytophagales bacterium]
ENMLRNTNRNSAYWYKFKIINKTHWRQQWLIESFNFRINHISLYLKTDSGFIESNQGDTYHFQKRPIGHKNFEFLLPYSSDTLTCYFRIKTKQHASFEIFIRRFDVFTSYAIGEYYLLGIFYGMIGIVAMFSLFMLLSFRKIVFLYYSLFLTGFGIFFMCQDGTGFQYIWPDFPIINSHSIVISRLVMLIPYTFYFCEFLEVRRKSPIVWKGMMIWILLRLTTVFIEDDNDFFVSILMYYDYIPFIVAYLSAIHSYRRGFKPALYFTIGFSVLLCAFIINSLRVACIVESNIFTAYSLNFGAIVEILFLSLALGSWLRRMIQEKSLTEKMNKLLEEKVNERTSVLQIQNNIINEKVNELDTLFYRLSHDIKGPLKSILGLAYLGILDETDRDKYFKLIQSSAKNLDKITSDFVQLNSVQKYDHENLSVIDFQALISSVTESLRYMPDFEKITIQTEIHQKEAFYSYQPIIYSVFLNIVENAIKYQRQDIKDAKLNIRIEIDKLNAMIQFSDNGVGISKSNQANVFNMFFREGVKEGVTGSGLGLYIVKMSLKKINGSITFNPNEDNGSTFIIEIDNTI